MSRIVFAFMRCNPPTKGHTEVIDLVRNKAHERGADNLVVLTRTQDHLHNPLSPEQKLFYAKHFWPDNNFELARPIFPSIVHYLRDLSARYHYITVVAGADRSDEYANLFKKYNHKEFSFIDWDVIEVGNSETRDDISATQMRTWAKDNSFVPFFFGSPKRSADDTTEVIKMYKDVRSGLK